MSGYISEVDYDGGAGSNFVEIVVPASIDASGYSLVVYDKDGTIIDSFGLGSPVTTFMGNNGYLIDDTTPNWVDVHNNEALALVDDTGTVIQFISFKDDVTAVEGPASGQTSTSIGEHSGGDKSLVTTDGGASYSPTPSSSPGTIPCFATGTLIATPNGPCAVEALDVGDLVCTRDGPPREIVFRQSREVRLDTATDDDLPVLIKAGALGQGRPDRDLIVSGQHRILLPGLPGHAGQQDEILAPAKALTDCPGIRLMRGKRQITWHHFAFARHAVVSAEGLATESLLLGPMVISGLSNRLGDEIKSLLGSEAPPLNGPPARRLASVREGRLRATAVDIATWPSGVSTAPTMGPAIAGTQQVHVFPG